MLALFIDSIRERISQKRKARQALRCLFVGTYERSAYRYAMVPGHIQTRIKA